MDIWVYQDARIKINIYSDNTGNMKLGKSFRPDRDSNMDLLSTVLVHYHCATETYN